MNNDRIPLSYIYISFSKSTTYFASTVSGYSKPSRHRQVKRRTKFPKGFKIWERENYNFLFSGTLRMSRIYFDKEKRVGLIYCSYACGRLCGEEVIICIRKINGKWIIEQNILLGVS